MALTTVIQSYLARPMTPNQISPANNLSRNLRQTPTTLRVRSMASDDLKDEVTKPVSGVPPPLTADQSPLSPPRPKAVVASTKFSDLLAFSGPAPERINGRLAMTGFAAALAVEIANGQDVFSQISNGGVTWLVGTSVLVSLASLVPLFKGVRVESIGSGRIMNPNAELWNGRVAMLGLIALAFTEYVKGGALV
ncbi:early light-induced protein 1, chloroplastic-like [Impatiens glandulifera]|uniref:early light-induced protein 1, chloroplastic-like n=1 Tax=Impatiens glandulifera TaxID=253017 RepID=UPI001FB0C257|nr:early light-induced protein 1, chloroplastic-like [Impatiens glandulifera]